MQFTGQIFPFHACSEIGKYHPFTNPCSRFVTTHLPLAVSHENTKYVRFLYSTTPLHCTGPKHLPGKAVICLRFFFQCNVDVWSSQCGGTAIRYWSTIRPRAHSSLLRDSIKADLFPPSVRSVRSVRFSIHWIKKFLWITILNVRHFLVRLCPIYLDYLTIGNILSTSIPSRSFSRAVSL